MPTVDVPSVGLVEFPDSMDQDAISGAIRSHFEKARTAGVNATIRGGLLPLQILTSPGVAEASEMGQAQGRIRRLLNTPPEMPPSTGEQRAASDLLLRPTDDEAYLRLINTPRAMRIAGIRRAIEEKTPDEITPSPEALQAAENETARWINPPKAVAQTALGALSEAQQAVGLPSYNVDKPVLPPGMGKNIVDAAGELIMPSAPGGSNLGPAGKGISEAASDLIQNLTPADAVAMATGPVGGAGYALEMAHGAPDQAAELGKAIGDKDPVAASKAAVNLAMGVAAPAGLVHGMARLASPSSVPVPDFPGYRLDTPRGAAPEATAAEVLRASPEEAAAQAEQMNRDAQAAAAIEKPKGPAGVQNPPTPPAPPTEPTPPTPAPPAAPAAGVKPALPAIEDHQAAKEMGATEFNDWLKQHGKSATRAGYEMGASLTSEEQAAAMDVEADKVRTALLKRAKEAEGKSREERDRVADELMQHNSKAQYFSEGARMYRAIQALKAGTPFEELAKTAGVDPTELKRLAGETKPPVLDAEAKPAEKPPVSISSPSDEAAKVDKPAETPPAAAAKVEAQVEKVAATEGTRPAKEIKSELVSRLEKSIAEAPAEVDVTTGAYTLANGKRVPAADKATKVTIEIPGDGTFTVRNTKEALSGLLERAKKIETKAVDRSRPKTIPGSKSDVSSDAVNATRAYGSADKAYQSVSRQLEALPDNDPETPKKAEAARALIDTLYHSTEAGLAEGKLDEAQRQLRIYEDGAEGFRERIAKIQALKNPGNARLAELADLKKRYKENQKRVDQFKADSDRLQKEFDAAKASLEAGTKNPPPEPPKLSEQATAYLDKAAEDALKRIQSRQGGTTFGSGPLHELPNIKDYAIYGAAKLAKLGVRSAEWANEMRKAFGKRIEPHLDKIYDAAKQYLEDYRNQTGSAGKLSSVQQIIAAHTGAEPVRLNGVTGAIDALQSSLRTVRALKEHFEGQPKVSKAEVKVADDFLEADANKIRESLTELVKNELPVSERGRFITAINNATKRVPILTGDPAAMYRQAARVAARIEERSQEVRKGAAIADLQKTVRSALNSPSVDLGYKKRILELMRRVSFTKPTAETLASLKATREYLDRMDAQGKETQIPREILDQLDLLTKIPLRDMPSEAVHALADKINQLEQLGRLKIESRQRVWDAEKASKLDQLSKENTIPFEKRAQVGSALKSERTTKEDFANALNKRLAGGELLDRAILPIDAGLELLQGGDPYRGWLFRNVRGPLDLAYNAYQVLRDNLAAEVESLVKKHKMGEAQAERINLYGIAMMEKGAHLPRLLAQGFTDEQISNVLRTITPEERAVYSAMRKAFDASLPDLQKIMHELYNIDVKPVEDYWPLPREWELTEVDPKDAKEPKFGKKMDFDELAGWQELLKDFRPKTTKTERGMTIERKPQAQTPVQTNAFEVFYRHINDVSYLLKHQRDLKLIGEMVRTDTFKQKYGSLGQTSVIDWLDTVAKQGRLGGLTRWNWLDSLRRRTSAGVISWRLGSQFVHLSSLPLSLKRTGFENYGRALAAVFTDKGQQFMKDNFAETFARGGGEPALIEAAHLGENPLIKQGAYRTAVRWGFSGARAIDRYNSQATALGVYMKELQRKGLDPSKYADLPVDKEAQAYALVQARRAVASPLSKDVSPSLARGAMFGNNVSVARSIQQFQNVFQDQWSNIRVDLWKNGIKARNPKEAAAMVIALTAMIVAETGIREGAKEVIKGVTGSNPNKKEDVGGKVAQEVLRRFPFGGQMTAWALYGESGIPTLDSLVSEGKNLHSAFTAKNPRTQNKAVIRSIGGAAQIAGVPGSSQGAELIEKSIR